MKTTKEEMTGFVLQLRTDAKHSKRSGYSGTTISIEVLEELVKPWLDERELHWGGRTGTELLDRNGLEVALVEQNVDKKNGRITAGKALWCKAKIHPGFVDIFDLPEDSVGVVGAYDSTKKARKALAAVVKKAGFFVKPYRSNKRKPK